MAAYAFKWIAAIENKLHISVVFITTVIWLIDGDTVMRAPVEKQMNFTCLLYVISEHSIDSMS